MAAPQMADVLAPIGSLVDGEGVYWVGMVAAGRDKSSFIALMITGASSRARLLEG